VIEGHHDAADRDIEAAVADLTALIAAHHPESQPESRALSPATPSL
jgi:hypothetical protein